jgi:DNA-binding CsgD family transcriptional regulator
VNSPDDCSTTNLGRVLQAGLQAPDLLGIGVILCNAFGQLLMANSTAHDLLKARDGLEINPDGLLCGYYSGGKQVSDLVRQAAKPAPAVDLPNINAVVSVSRSSGERALTILIRSVRGTYVRGRRTAPKVLVVVLNPSLGVEVDEGELNLLYGFTSAEARLANLLMEGKSVDDCCHELGCRRSTAAAHLRRMFKKTCVHRQSELVSLLLKSIGLVRRRRNTKTATELPGPFERGANKLFLVQGTSQPELPDWLGLGDWL